MAEAALKLSVADADANMGRRLRNLFGGSIGNLIEWYDFYVYNFFALYFAKAFFPSDKPTVQLMNTAAIAATEALYAEMWAQDAAAMYGYAGSSAAVTAPSTANNASKNSAGAPSAAAGM